MSSTYSTVIIGFGYVLTHKRLQNFDVLEQEVKLFQFSLIKMFKFGKLFVWNLFFTLSGMSSQRYFKKRLLAHWAPSHLLKQCWLWRMFSALFQGKACHPLGAKPFLEPMLSKTYVFRVGLPTFLSRYQMDTKAFPEPMTTILYVQ